MLLTSAPLVDALPSCPGLFAFRLDFLQVNLFGVLAFLDPRWLFFWLAPALNIGVLIFFDGLEQVNSPSSCSRALLQSASSRRGQAISQSRTAEYSSQYF